MGLGEVFSMRRYEGNKRGEMGPSFVLFRSFLLAFRSRRCLFGRIGIGFCFLISSTREFECAQAGKAEQQEDKETWERCRRRGSVRLCVWSACAISKEGGRRSRRRRRVDLAFFSPTLRDAVHDLARHFEAGGQTGGEGRRKVDGHVSVVAWSTQSHCVELFHWHMGHYTAEGRARREQRSAALAVHQHPFGTRTEPEKSFTFAGRCRCIQFCPSFRVSVEVGMETTAVDLMARCCDLREMKPRCCRRARLAAPPPPPSMHVHRAGLLHPNQYHTLSQKTDPTRAGLCTLQPAAAPLSPSCTETPELDGGADGAAAAAATATDAAGVLGAFP